MREPGALFTYYDQLAAEEDWRAFRERRGSDGKGEPGALFDYYDELAAEDDRRRNHWRFSTRLGAETAARLGGLVERALTTRRAP